MRVNNLNKVNNINKVKIFKLFRVSFFSFCLVATLVSITQSFNKVSAVESSSSATASVTVSSACSFSRTNESDGNYTGTLSNGSSAEIPGSTFKTICNDPGGYAIYAIGYSNNTLGNTDLIFNDTPESTNNIKTNGDTLVGGNGSYWKMKLSPVSGAFTPTIENSYSNYGNIPSNYTKVASFSNVTVNSSDSTTGSSVTASYLAYASSTQPAGTYTGTVKYTMVHPSTNVPDQPRNCTANKICYFPNAGNTVADTMGDQTIGAADTSATLWASNFQRPGYGFAGWSDTYDYVDNPANPNAHIYGPNEDIEFEAGAYDGVGDHSAGLSLYAIWVKSTSYLQDWTGCQNLTQTTYNSDTGKLNADLSSITALTDKRDNQTYAVARLADGNCWMIENLRLDAEYTRGSYYQSLAQGYGGVFNGLADAEAANFSNSTVANSLYSIDGSTTYTIDITSHTINGTDYTGYYFPRYRNTNTASPVNSPTGNGGNMYSYGNYYTWTAAMANTTYYSGYNNPDPTNVSGSDAANTSICPKGWRLPLGANRNTTNLSFSKLDKQMGGTGASQSSAAGTTQSKKWRSFPNNFLCSGDAGNSNIINRGSYGSYWTSSSPSNGGGRAYFLNPGSSYLAPGTNQYYKSSGFSVRCVLAP